MNRGRANVDSAALPRVISARCQHPQHRYRKPVAKRLAGFTLRPAAFVLICRDSFDLTRVGPMWSSPMALARAHTAGGANLNDTAGIAQHVMTQAQRSGVTVSAGN